MTPPLNDRHDPIVIACALFNYREIEVYAPNGSTSALSLSFSIKSRFWGHLRAMAGPSKGTRQTR